MDQRTMFQCELRKGRRVHIGWIESRGAWVGAAVELKLGDGLRDPGWRVTQVWGSMPEEQVMVNATAYKYHRARTDV